MVGDDLPRPRLYCFDMLSRSTRLRLVLVSVLLPSVIVVADSAVLSMAGASHWSSASAFAAFALFLAQGSAVGYAAGRWLPGWSWRLLLLGWLTILVDLLLYTASVVSGGGGDYDARADLLVFGFFGSQLSAGLIWGILGSLAWRCRLSGAALAAAPATYFLLRITAEQGYHTASWLAVVLVQAIGVAGVCGLLRAVGYRIEYYGNTTSAHGSGLQFTIGHMLIWTLAASLIVSVFKQVAIHSSGEHGLREWLQLAIAGTMLAIVALAAMWMVLGAGRGMSKVVIALSIAASAGAFLWYVDWQFKSRTTVFGLPYAGPWWIGWSLLAEPFLAGLLLVFSTTGYSLVWHRRISS